MPNPLRTEYQAKKRELAKARELAERLQKEGDYYDMAARLQTAKKSLSLLETQWKRLHHVKRKIPVTIKTQTKEKQIDLEIVEVEKQITVLGNRIEQITDILKNTERPTK